MKKTVLIALFLLIGVAPDFPQPGYSWGHRWYGPGAVVGAALLGAVIGGRLRYGYHHYGPRYYPGRGYRGYHGGRGHYGHRW